MKIALLRTALTMEVLQSQGEARLVLSGEGALANQGQAVDLDGGAVKAVPVATRWLLQLNMVF